MIYNVSMKIAHLLENEQAVAVFDRFLPGMRKMAVGNPQAAQLSVEQLVRYTRNPKANEVIAALDEALNALNTPENAVSPSERKLIERFKSIEAEDRAKAQKPADHRQDAICPGQPWLDRFDRFYADTYETYRQEQEERVKGMQNFYQILGTVQPFRHPTGIPITEEDAAASGCDTALYVLARQAGEGNDRVDDLRRSAARVLWMVRQNTVLASK